MGRKCRLVGKPIWRRALVLAIASLCVLVLVQVVTVAGAEDALIANGADRLLVTVNGHAIHERHVRREIDLALARPRISPNMAVRMTLERPTLDLLIDRRLVLDALRLDKRAAADAEVDVEIERLSASLARRNQTFADYLKAQGQTTEDLRNEVTWRLSWRRFFEAELTDAAVETYFEQHRRQFDGTRLRVSHILFALAKNADDKAAAEAMDRAARLRERIVADEISFADAAMQFSDAPSKADGGDIGSITRRGEQHESFAAAAFAIAVGEISPPTRTPHGVHLIRCTAEAPGKKELADVREAVVRAATMELFRKHADAERPKAKVEYANRAAVSNE